MTQPLSDLAIEAHYQRVVDEGGERVIKEMSIEGYRVAVVYFAGTELLVIRPEPRPDEAFNVGIPRSEIARYLLPTGDASTEAMMQAPEWLRTMGKEVTPMEIYKLCKALESMWTYFYNVMPDNLRLSERQQIGEVELYVDGELKRSAPL